MTHPHPHPHPHTFQSNMLIPVPGTGRPGTGRHVRLKGSNSEVLNCSDFIVALESPGHCVVKSSAQVRFV